MWFTATVNAYDVMDRVQVTVTVRAMEDTPGSVPQPVLTITTTVQGTGEADCRHWLEDALVGLLERL